LLGYPHQKNLDRHHFMYLYELLYEYIGVSPIIFSEIHFFTSTVTPINNI
jgi:hypothetical protein